VWAIDTLPRLSSRVHPCRNLVLGSSKQRNKSDHTSTTPQHQFFDSPALALMKSSTGIPQISGLRCTRTCLPSTKMIWYFSFLSFRARFSAVVRFRFSLGGFDFCFFFDIHSYLRNDNFSASSMPGDRPGSSMWLWKSATRDTGAKPVQSAIPDAHRAVGWLHNVTISRAARHETFAPPTPRWKPSLNLVRQITINCSPAALSQLLVDDSRFSVLSLPLCCLITILDREPAQPTEY